MNTLKNGKQRWELLYDYVCNNMKSGDFIPHTQIELIIGANYKNPATNTTSSLYGSAVARTIKELTKVQKRMISIHGQGYRVMFDNEYIYDAASNYSRAYKAVTKALFILDNTPLSMLTPAEKTLHSNLAQYVKATETFMAKKNLSVQSSVGAAKKVQKTATVKPAKNKKVNGTTP